MLRNSRDGRFEFLTFHDVLRFGLAFSLDCRGWRGYTFIVRRFFFPESMMQAIYDKAEELADLIISSSAYRNLRAAEKDVEGNEGVKKLVDQFNQHLTTMAEKERKLQPIEPEEKHELQRLREQMQGSEMLQRLLRAQTEYAMMMNRINSILKTKLERRESAS